MGASLPAKSDRSGWRCTLRGLPRVEVKTKKSCCKSRPRCKRCPVVCKRLESAGHAERTGKRTWVLVDVTKKQLKAARA
jgi:hypothetical protein